MVERNKSPRQGWRARLSGVAVREAPVEHTLNLRAVIGAVCARSEATQHITVTIGETG